MKKLWFNPKNRKTMGNLLLAAGFCLFCLSAHGRKDTVTVKKRGVTIHTSNKNYKKYGYHPEIFLDFGYNGADKYNLFTDAGDNSMGDFPQLRANQSKAFSIYLTVRKKLTGNHLSLMSGGGFDWFNFRFRNGATLKDIDGITQNISMNDLYPSCVHVEKSKLVSSYFTVPLLLRIDFHKFFVAAGITGSINISNHTRTIHFDQFDNQHKYRDYDINTAPFRYGYVARVGYRGIALFANYYMTTLFPKHEGPSVYPFSMGVSLKLN